MKLIIVLALVALAAAQVPFTNKYDHINVEEILMSDRLFKNYFNCLIDEGACTPEASELKEKLPEALENNCELCTEKQKDTSVKVIRYLIDKRPVEWGVLKTKFDPNNKFVDRYREEAEAAGIKLQGFDFVTTPV